MADEPTTPEGAKPEGEPAPPDKPEGDAPLGEAGEKALREERQGRKAAEKAAKDAQAELEKLRAENATEAEKALAAAKAEGRNEALSTANERLVKAEVKAAAAGVLADPSDASRLLDLDQFDVDDDGNVDSKAIKAAIASLVKDKPYLAVGGSKPSSLPGGGATPSTGQSMDDWIRSAAKG